MHFAGNRREIEGKSISAAVESGHRHLLLKSSRSVYNRNGNQQIHASSPDCQGQYRSQSGYY